MTIVNWERSLVTKQILDDFVSQGLLVSQQEIRWWVSNGEAIPTPAEDEIVVFTDHILRGFTPPGSRFFRDLLHYFNLHPQDIGPNSVSNICHFQIFYEVYLQTAPTVPLFKEFFYINRQTECKNGPSQELDGISIQRWRDNNFPSTVLPVTPRDG